VTNLEGGSQHPLYDALLDACCSGIIAVAAHDQARRHLAICFLLKKEYQLAFEHANQLARQSPDWVDVQILEAQILHATPGATSEALRKVVELKRMYRLTASQEAQLSAIEATISGQRDSG